MRGEVTANYDDHEGTVTVTVTVSVRVAVTVTVTVTVAHCRTAAICPAA